MSSARIASVQSIVTGDRRLFQVIANDKFGTTNLGSFRRPWKAQYCAGLRNRLEELTPGSRTYREVAGRLTKATNRATTR